MHWQDLYLDNMGTITDPEGARKGSPGVEGDALGNHATVYFSLDTPLNFITYYLLYFSSAETQNRAPQSSIPTLYTSRNQILIPPHRLLNL